MRVLHVVIDQQVLNRKNKHELPLRRRAWIPCGAQESPGKLLEMLEGKSLGISPLSPIEAWLGVHADRRSARKVYLLLARKWHPDKWAVQGWMFSFLVHSIAISTLLFGSRGLWSTSRECSIPLVGPWQGSAV